MNKIPFQAIDWSNIKKTKAEGETGFSLSQTMQFDGLTMRIVEYSANYLADHWCQKGHIVHCLEGAFRMEHEHGEAIQMTKGMSYIVSDNLSSHRSFSETGTKLLIIDGNFLGKI